jgi:hypothetical protein
MTQFLVYLLDVSIVSAAFSVMSFIVLYTLRNPWWSNAFGRTLMTVLFGLSIVLATNMLTGIGVKTEHSDVLICMRIVAFLTVTVGCGGLTRNLFRASQLAKLRGKQ